MGALSDNTKHIYMTVIMITRQGKRREKKKTFGLITKMFGHLIGEKTNACCAATNKDETYI